MYWDVTDVNPVAPRTLAVRFADGLSGTLYIDRSFCTGVFEALLEDDLVNEAQVQNDVVAWPNGLDLAPDTMYRKIKGSPERHYDMVAA
jgi:hypothetical protein